MQQSKAKSIGIVTAPGYTDHFGDLLTKELPDLLANAIDSEIRWDVEYLVDPLTGVTEDSEKIKKATYSEMKEKDWDIAICLTDLPFFHNKSPIVMEMDRVNNIAWVSVPSLGIFPLKRRIISFIMRILKDLTDPSYDSEEPISKESGKRKKLKSLSPFQRLEMEDKENGNGNVLYTYKPKIIGNTRLILGMLRANQPWVIFPHFLKIVVVAFTTGCFALVFPTMWKLSSHYNTGRMLLITFLAIGLMVTWIILIHKLWEKPHKGRSKSLRIIYNVTTVFTLLLTVIFYYIILYICFIFASITLIPSELLQTEISGKVDLLRYLSIAWTATSISTFIGAFGTTLENEEAVLSTTYGNRQRQRYEKVKKMKRKQEDDESS
ncbi:hypothetical protein SAMN04487944_10348 [Gracilibacillus ureilyticus]|uniref:5,10-methylene-tetrahydrofolate dehydrogenase n=1 Tax=Gracilibacillus ureilyticus TaxID=531814 RepID=A0A1H9NBG5_9BACI|nr:hypothetical protein [Gracilibacillus ureilyticus]SER33015.1 hypothetical protein SAMN04487944_10348 [Gracilibacillus ureilyticus]